MPSKDKAITKRWRDENKEHLYHYRRQWSMKNWYGITVEEFDRMFDEQNGQCAICSVALVKFKAEKQKTAHVDHCHETKKVRGILCNECNRGLGEFKDDVHALEQAILYLKKSNAS
jgi:hypothetical protein